MKQIYILPVVLLILINMGCTRKAKPLLEESEKAEESQLITEIPGSIYEKPLPEESGKDEQIISIREEVKSMYANSPEGLRMRDKPDISGNRILLLGYGQEVMMLKIDPGREVIDGIEGQWVYVQANAMRGWVFSGYLSEKKELTAEEELKVKEELEQFAARYGGNVSRFYQGGANRFALMADKEDMFSHLGELSDVCIRNLQSLSVPDISEKRYPVIPPLDKRLVLDIIVYRGVGLENIDALAQTNVRWLNLEINPLTSIAAIGNNPYIERLFLSGCTDIKSLPDMSGMKKLTILDIKTTGVTTLDNIDTIPHPFDIYLFGCTELTDIDALRRSKVRKLFIDRKGYSVMGGISDEEGLYDRFREWFEQYLPELEQKEGFQLLHAFENFEG